MDGPLLTHELGRARHEERITRVRRRERPALAQLLDRLTARGLR